MEQSKGSDSSLIMALQSIARAVELSHSAPNGYTEVTRFTNTVASDAVTVSFNQYKYLLIEVIVYATGGTSDISLRLNSDSGANYVYTHTASYAAATAAVSQTSIPLESGATDSGGIMTGKIQIIGNIAAEEKNLLWDTVSQDAAGAATQAVRLEGHAKWANTSAMVTSITLTNAGTGDIGIGSEIVVYGRN